MMAQALPSPASVAQRKRMRLAKRLPFHRELRILLSVRQRKRVIALQEVMRQISKRYKGRRSIRLGVTQHLADAVEDVLNA